MKSPSNSESQRNPKESLEIRKEFVRIPTNPIEILTEILTEIPIEKSAIEILQNLHRNPSKSP